MKDLQWILDTAASAYEKRFMKKTIIITISILKRKDVYDVKK